MDETKYLESLLASLRKPQSGKRLIQILIAIRKQVNAPDHKYMIGLIKFNSLKVLISCTQYEANSKIVDLALSVLGNCCTNRSITRQAVYDLNILHNLHRVLGKYDHDSIQGRVFRILGNLSDGVEPVRMIEKEPSVIKDVLSFLDSYSNGPAENEPGDIPKFSVPTVSMAMRFVRKLLVPRTFETMIVDFRVAETVRLLLIKCAGLWSSEKNDRALVGDLMKILQIMSFSMSSYHDVILSEFKNPENGDALKSLGDIVLYDPEKMVKIMLKFGPSLKHQSDLPIAAIVTTLLGAVRPNLPAAELSNKAYLESVNKLMNHVGFHDKLNHSGNLVTLIGLLRTFDGSDDASTECCLQIFSILYKCRYNESLVKTQLSEDIVTIIIERLERITRKPSDRISVVPHQMRTLVYPFYGVRRKSAISEIFSKDNDVPEKRSKYSNSRSYCASPSSCSDVSSCGPFSPGCSTGHWEDVDSDSDNYSPLCSETEADDEGIIEVPEDDVMSSETEDNRPLYNQDQMVLRYRLQTEMCMLLKYYCTLRPLQSQLGNPRLITILLNIVLDFSCDLNDSVYLVAMMIIQTPEFLIPLLTTRIVPQVYELKEGQHKDPCVVCKELQIRAESVVTKFARESQRECVKGDVAHILLNKNKNDLKEKLVVTIPYVVRDSAIVRRLMKECGGLGILIKLLRNRSDVQTFENSFRSVCVLATENLKIKNPVHVKQHPRKKSKTASTLHIGRYHLPCNCENVVVFKLDDGSLVEADRDALSNESDYFAALLNGQFAESGQTVISLGDVAPDSLRCLLQLLTLNVKLKAKLVFQYSLDTILDVVLLTDRFLLTSLHYALVCHVEQRMNARTVVKYYKWSIESGTNIMRVETVVFLLVADILYKEKLGFLNALCQMDYFDELVEDVEKVIAQFL